MAFSPLHDADALTLEQMFRIYDGVQDHSLPKAEWTHEAHLVAGLCLVAELGIARAETLMPDIIRRYNVAMGGVNSETEGYHHTLTIFYLREIDNMLQASPHGSLLTEAKSLLRSPIADRAYPLRHYTKECLFSRGARLGWLAPE